MVLLDGDRSAYFHIVNGNRTAITIDFKSPGGLATFDQLLADSDVFLTNFLPRPTKPTLPPASRFNDPQFTIDLRKPNFI
jgi:hypothetical protein